VSIFVCHVYFIDWSFLIMRKNFAQQRVRLRSRQGFTLVEVLVVVFIIGLLAALVLPAVNTARETAYRTTSANNQKQLALGLIQHNDTLGFLPHSQRVGNSAAVPRRGIWVDVLPYIERKDLFDRYDFSKGWQTTFNTPVTLTRIETFINPTSPDPGRLDDAPEAAPWAGIVASGDYAVVTHVAQALFDAGLVDEVGDGALPKNKISRLADIRDGLSHTILLGDSAGRPYQWIKGRRNGTPYSANSTTAANPNVSGVGASGNAATALIRVNGGGWSRNASDISLEGATVVGTFDSNNNRIYTVTRTGPVAINAWNGEDVIPLGVSPNTTYYGTNGTGAFYSFHPGGINVAFADGGVKFISEKIDIRVLAKLVTRNGGEVVADGTY
jgi:prepilin-type N-terminal cleavage/methylation domain-containing protein/prepilin-type processing-associated H-X9-DG protein